MFYIIALFFGLSAILAQSSPCDSIVDTCKNAGFVNGGWRSRNDLFINCVNPIAQNETSDPMLTKPIPVVPVDTIVACLKKTPTFGKGPIGFPGHFPLQIVR